MNFFLRFAACLIVILVGSAGAAMAWDSGDRAASPQRSEAGDAGR